MISYQKTFDLLKAKGINMTRLRKENIVTQSALTSMRRNEHINTRTIERLCAALDCQPSDLMEYVPAEQENADK